MMSERPVRAKENESTAPAGPFLIMITLYRLKNKPLLIQTEHN